MFKVLQISRNRYVVISTHSSIAEVETNKIESREDAAQLADYWNMPRDVDRHLSSEYKQKMQALVDKYELVK